jgi:hypothetical protein
LIESNAVEPTTSTLTGPEVIEEKRFGNVKLSCCTKRGIVTAPKTFTIVELSRNKSGMIVDKPQRPSALERLAGCSLQQIEKPMVMPIS